MTKSRIGSLALCAALFAGGAVVLRAQDRGQGETEGQDDSAPSGKGIGTRHQPGPQSGHAAPRARVRGNGIFYHGGPIMLGPTTVYYIWYGNWSGNSATTIL